MNSAIVPVFEWLYSDGKPFGCGTQVEFDYWREMGVNPDDAQTGRVICHEPAIQDEQRKAQWGIA